MDVDLFKGTCQEFGKVFTEDLASLEEIDDKIQHHAEALTNCLKLVQSNPQSLSVQKLWMSLIRSSLKFLLHLDPAPSQPSLKRFVDTIEPWLINDQFTGLCRKELLDMYNLALKGPWSQPVLRNLIAGDDVSSEEMKKLFDDGLCCIEYHMRSLYMSSKTTQLLTFAQAALSHPQVGRNKSVQKLFQSYASDIVNEQGLIQLMDKFDFEVTIALLNESIQNKISCYKLCNAAVKYLLRWKKMKHLQEIMSCWITVLRQKYSEVKLFNFLSKNIIESVEFVNSVQPCVALVHALWNVVAEPSRMMCVEILWRALQLLSSDEPDSDQLRKGILSSIAYFLPNSQVSRSCILTIFISMPTVAHYFEVAKTYKVAYDRGKDIAKDCKAHLRLSILEYLQGQWPQEFLQSSSWDWALLRTVCRKMLSQDDLEIVESEEREEEEDADVAAASSAHQAEETGESSSPDPCLSGSIAEKAEQSTLEVQDSSGTRAKRPKSDGSKVHDKACVKKPTVRRELPEEICFTCPEENCQRSYRSKIGMSKHLSKIHGWPMNEIHDFYATVLASRLKAITDEEAFAEKNAESREKVLCQPESNPDETQSAPSVPLPENIDKELTNKDVNAGSELLSPSVDVPVAPDPVQILFESAQNSQKIDESQPSETDTNVPAVLTDLDHSIMQEPIEPMLLLPEKDSQTQLSVTEQTQAKPSVSRENSPEPKNQPASATYTNESVPSLPPIFSTRNTSSTERSTAPTPEVSHEELSIECPVCSRSFKHRHTVQEHIEFRHKITPEKAAEMAKDAKFAETPDSRPGAAEEIQTSEADMRSARGWYSFLDDFFEEFQEAPFQGVPSTSSNRLSLDYIVMYTLGRMPSSFDAALAEKEISKWSFAAKRKNYDSSNPLALSPIAPEVAPVDELPVKMVESTRTRSKSSESTPGPFSLDRNSSHRPGVDSHKSTATKLLRKQSAGSAKDKTSSDPPRFSSSSYTQTNFKTVARFSKTDHYHNLPSVRNQKLKKTKKNEYPVARTIISGNFLKNRTRTLASQCCQDEIKNWSSAGKSVANLAKRRSSHDAFSKALFSVSDDDSLPISQPKVKRRYDMQTVYHLADLSRDQRADAASFNPVVSSKSSFEDALNSAPRILDKNKAKRKLSKSRESDEGLYPSSKRSSSSNLFDLGNLKETSSIQLPKKQKPKKLRSNRALSSSMIKKHVIADVVVKKKNDDNIRQLFPTHDYEELLKHAEELNSSGQTKQLKANKPSSSIANSGPPVVSKPTSINQPVCTSSPDPVDQSNNADEVTFPPLHAPDDNDKISKKAPKIVSGKRRIDLRKLSSLSKYSPPPSVLRNASDSLSDDNRSVPDKPSCSSPDPDPDPPEPVFVSPPETESQDATLAAPEKTCVICPICSKSMSSDFALACHMRKRHKVRSKKVFIPGQSLESAHDSSSSNCSSKSTKESKNVRGPPEGLEACSDPATFRSARNNPNASDFSSSSDDDLDDAPAFVYSADVSAQTCSDRSRFEMSIDDGRADLPTASLIFSTSPISHLQNNKKEDDFDQDALTKADEDDVALVPESSSPVRHPADKALQPIESLEKISENVKSIESTQSNYVASECSRNQATSERCYSVAEIVIRNNRYACPVDDCQLSYKHYRNLKTHCFKKHWKEYQQIWPRFRRKKASTKSRLSYKKPLKIKTNLKNCKLSSPVSEGFEPVDQTDISFDAQTDQNVAADNNVITRSPCAYTEPNQDSTNDIAKPAFSLQTRSRRNVENDVTREPLSLATPPITNNANDESSSKTRLVQVSANDATENHSSAQTRPNEISDGNIDEAILTNEVSSAGSSSAIAHQKKEHRDQIGPSSSSAIQKSFFVTTYKNQKYCCPVENCTHNYKNFRHLKRHCKEKHSQFYLDFAILFMKTSEPIHWCKPQTPVKQVIKYFCPARDCFCVYSDFAVLQNHYTANHFKLKKKKPIKSKCARLVELSETENSDSPSTHMTETSKGVQAVGIEQLKKSSVPFIAKLRKGKHRYPIQGCSVNYRRLEDREHSGKDKSVLSEQDQLFRDDDGATKDRAFDEAECREPSIRRTAYNEASLQIQLSSVKLTSRRSSTEQELMRLYNKRARAKVARALSPAQSKFSKLNLCQKRGRSESNESTDSYEADYDAQLPCWHCQMMFHCRRNLTLHIQHHLRIIDLSPYRCDSLGCLYGFKTKDELDRHKMNHKKRYKHICLFCPNQSRSFRSFRKLIRHENEYHTNLQVNLEKLRRTHCINSSRIYVRESLKFQTSESFLADGHRRKSSTASEGVCDECLSKHGQIQEPSVADFVCDHVIHSTVYRVVDDMVSTAVEFEELCLERKSAKAELSAARTKSGSEVKEQSISRAVFSKGAVASGGTITVFDSCNSGEAELIDESKESRPQQVAEIETQEEEKRRWSQEFRESEDLTLQREPGGSDDTNERNNNSSIENQCESLDLVRKSSKTANKKDAGSNVSRTVSLQNIDRSRTSEDHETEKDGDVCECKMIELRKVELSKKKSQLNHTSVVSDQPFHKPCDDTNKSFESCSSDRNLARDTNFPPNNKFSSPPLHEPAPAGCLPIGEGTSSQCAVPLVSASSCAYASSNSFLRTTSSPVQPNDIHGSSGGAVDNEESAEDLEDALEVIHVVHKLVCDVEVDEQATFMRMCGYVPTGVMYFKQGDLLSSPGVALSVYGYNSEAFALLDMAESSSSNLPASSSYPSIQGFNSELPHCSSSNPTTSLAPAAPPHPLFGSLFPFQNNLLSTLNLLSNLPSIAASPSSLDLVRMASSVDLCSPLLAASAFQVLLQTKLCASYFHQNHPMWKLDADEFSSEICNIFALDRISRKLFCRHYVVPNPSLKLAPPPLSGICTSYPVMTDAPRYNAFTAVSGEFDNQLVSVCPRTSQCGMNPVPPLPSLDESFREALAASCLPTVDVMSYRQMAETETPSSKPPDNRAVASDAPSQAADLAASDNQVNPADTTREPASEHAKVQGSDDREIARHETFSSVETVVEGDPADTSFFDGFMEEIRFEKAHKKKNKKFRLQKPIFTSRGRPKKSFDKLHTKGYERRSLPEIVAFCNSSFNGDQLIAKPEKNLKSKVHLGAGSNLDIDCDLPDDLNPVVKVTRASECLLNHESPFTISGGGKASNRTYHVRSDVANEPRQAASHHACLSYRSKEVASTSALLDSVEATISKASKPSLRKKRMPSQSNPATLVSDIALDHSYAMSCSSSFMTLSSLNEAPSCADDEVEISDYCEEICVEESDSPLPLPGPSEESDSPLPLPGLSPKNYSSVVCSQEESSFEAESSDSNLLVSASLNQGQDVAADPTDVSAISVPVSQNPSSCAQSTVAPKASNLIPCLFCSLSFASISDCKRHFIKMHIRVNKEAKPSPNPRTHTAKLVTGAKKRLMKISRHKHSKRDFPSKKILPQINRVSHNTSSLCQNPSAPEQPQSVALQGGKVLGASIPATVLAVQAEPQLVRVVENKGRKTLILPCTSAQASTPRTATHKNQHPTAQTGLDRSSAPSLVAVSVKHLSSLINIHNTSSTAQLIKGTNIVLKDGKYLLAQPLSELPATPGTRSLLQQVPRSVSLAINNKLREEVQRLKLQSKTLPSQKRVTKSLAVVAPFRSSDSSGSQIVISDDDEEVEERPLFSFDLARSVAATVHTSSLQTVAINSSRTCLNTTFRNRSIPADQTISVASRRMAPIASSSIVPSRDTVTTQRERLCSFDLFSAATSSLQIQPITTKSTCHVIVTRERGVTAASPILTSMSDLQSIVSVVPSQARPRMSSFPPTPIRPQQLEERNLFSSFSVEDRDNMPMRRRQDVSTSRATNRETSRNVFRSKSSGSVSSATHIVPQKRAISKDGAGFAPRNFSLGDVQMKRARLSEGALISDDSFPPDFAPILSREGAVRSLSTLSSASLRLFQCRCCSSAYANKYDYKMHMFLVHSLYLCSFKHCNDLLDSEQHLEEHCHLKHGVKRRSKLKSKALKIFPGKSDDKKIKVSSSRFRNNLPRFARNTKSSDLLPRNTTPSEKENGLGAVVKDEIPSFDPDDVWDVEVSSNVLNKWHKRLLTEMASLPGKEFLSLVRFEVRSLIKHCRITCDKLNRLFMRCPLSNCRVYGNKKQLLFDHILKEHQLSQIMSWIRDHDSRLKVNNVGYRNLRKRVALSELRRHFNRWRKLYQSVIKRRSRDPDLLRLVGDQLLEQAERSGDSCPVDKNFKCRFIECGKTIGGQSNFSHHMITKHSPSRVAWHKERGRLLPLFNPVVVVSRSATSFTSSSQNETDSSNMTDDDDDDEFNLYSSATDEQSTLSLMANQLSNSPSSPPVLAENQESSPKTPLVVLKKLSSVSSATD